MPGLVVFLVILSIGLISGALMVVGAVLMRSTDRSRVRTGSVLVLIFTLVGLLFTAGGLIVGFILGIAGSIMGLVWKPHEKAAPTVPAPTVPAPTVPAPTVPAPTVPAPTVSAPSEVSQPAP